MMNMVAMTAEALGRLLHEDFRRTFGSAHQEHAERLDAISRVALECLGKSDALYHNVEHTLLVTLVGLDILLGRMLTERIEPDDYAHLIVACLLHDIGYVRGILSGDQENGFVVDESGRRVTLPRGSSDAALAPYHVERSIMFVKDRLGRSPSIDADRVVQAIEFTRFPCCREPPIAPESIEAKLVQGADLIGQLGDPLYSRKANALFHEFEEVGVNRQLGYTSPADLIERFPD